MTYMMLSMAWDRTSLEMCHAMEGAAGLCVRRLKPAATIGNERVDASFGNEMVAAPFRVRHGSLSAG